MSLADLIGLGRDIGTRFALVGLLPSGILALFVLALLWSGAPGSAPDLDRVLDHARGLDGWEGGLLFLAIVAATLVVQPLQLGLVRLLEGYRWPGGVARRPVARQRREFDRLAAVAAPRPDKPTPREEAEMGAADSELRRRFPADPDVVLPTALGNALRAAETRAGEPYGLDVVVAWPRLYPLLSDGVRALVDDQRDSLDLAARLCAVLSAAAVISFALLVPHLVWLLIPAGCLLLAWLAYRGAVAAAIAYGEGIRTAIDLHRFDLLAALHLPLPATLEQERAINEQLSLFLRQDWPINLVYAHGAGAGETEAAAERADAG